MATHLPLETGGMTAVEQFLDVIAHEVRTPLSLARMAAETVVTTELPPDERARLLRMILRNADLALLLLDRMGLARDVEAGTVRLQLAETDVTALVRETIEDLESLVLGTHPVQIDGLARCSVPADPTALREILLNLLLNAAKYSPEQSPIEVSVEGDGREVTVVVSDHGCGVAPADLERIFEQYMQVQSGGSGVGLGLYISRGLARAHGGELAVRRRGDDGSDFVLRLPRNGADAAGGVARQQPVG
jgi:two-component system, OmpR family, sensor histidine kinase MtrB